MNEITVINGVPSIVVDGQVVAVPTYAQGHVVENDFGRAGGLPTISPFTTTTFKIRIQDQEKVVAAPLRVVILGVTPKGTANNRAYYKDQYVAGQVAAPDCSSRDGITPDEGDHKQSATCATCPMSVFGSSATGKGQACSQGKTLFVTPDSAIDGPIYQVRVAPTSLKSVAAYGTKLASVGIPPAMVITSLGLIPEVESQKTYPILRLDLAGFLDEASAQKAMDRSQSPEIVSMIATSDTAPVQQVQTSSPAQDAVAAGFGQAVNVQNSFDQAEQAQQAAQTQEAPVDQEALIAERVAAAVAQALADQTPPTHNTGSQLTPEQVDANRKAFVAEQTAKKATSSASNEDLDSAGMPWNAEIHSSGKTKIQAGTWKLKKGVTKEVVAAATGGPTKVEKEAGTNRQAEQAQTVEAPAQTGGGDELADILNQWG